MKPKIYLYGTSGQYGNYLAALTEAGAEPVLSRDLFRACGCDGLLLPGGGDIGVTLEATDSFLIRSFADSGRPILGICRGIQALNVFLGGTLYQHIDGHQQSGVPYEALEYPLEVLPDGLLYRLCGKTEIKVNSYHHQNVKQLAPSLRADGVSRDGYIEALHSVEHPFLLAVQFHPEIYNGLPDDDHSAAIFGAFIGACR